MEKFFSKLEEFEVAFAVACIRIYLLNHQSGYIVPNYLKLTLDNVQEDLSDVIRHYVRFEDYECCQLIG